MENFKFYAFLIFVIVIVCSILALPIVFIISLFSAVDDSYNTCMKNKEVIGKNVIINKDTLQITDYSCMTNTYVLSDKNEIDGDAINSFIIK